MEAVVSHKKWVKRKGYEGRWNIDAAFIANDNMYHTFFVEDVNNVYEIGDSINVIYSTRNPEISKLTELEK